MKLSSQQRTSKLNTNFERIKNLPPIETTNNINYSTTNTPADLYFGSYASPFGNSLIAMTTAEQLVFWGFGSDQKKLYHELKRRWYRSKLIEDNSKINHVGTEIFANPKEISQIPLLLKGTPFQIIVWQQLLSIPMGSIVTYQKIAQWIDKPKASRAVGTAVGKNDISFLIPCHRVIPTTGKTGNYYWGSDKKDYMLGWESYYD